MTNTLTIVRVLLLAAGSLWADMFLQPLFASDRPASRDGDRLAARVDRQVQAWEPTRAERRLDEIGWARDIRTALRLAAEHHRPIFLFTYSGSAVRDDALALQRC